MSRLMDIGTGQLGRILLKMAELSEKSVATSIEGYSRGKTYSKEIRDWSDQLRAFEDEVSDLAIELIARYQPVATDLRFIKACLEISYGFSRFGRYAYDIEQVLEMFGDVTDCDHSIVEETAKITKQMIRMSIESFSNRDLELAKKVRQMDDSVDEKYRSHVKNMIKGGKDLDPVCYMSATLIMRYLERISDHSSYICESVIYIVTGRRAENSQKNFFMIL